LREYGSERDNVHNQSIKAARVLKAMRPLESRDHLPALADIEGLFTVAAQHDPSRHAHGFAPEPCVGNIEKQAHAALGGLRNIGDDAL
jgi:hypothetical protein